MIEVRMYDKNLAFLDVVPNRVEPQFTEQLSDPGVGSFKLHTQDYQLARTTHLLDYGNIVLMHDVESGHFFAWRIEARKRKLVDSGTAGRENLMWEVSGRGAGCLLQAGILYPEYGLYRTSQDDRPFNFATKESYWYNPAQWVAPHGRIWKTDATSRRHYPKGWPDPDAYWIWNTDPNASAAAGVCYFRGTFHLSFPERVAIFASGDNSYQLYLDGELVMSGRSWKMKQRFDADLQTGDHIIAIRGVNAPLSGVNPAGVICTVFAVDAETEQTQYNLFRTNVTDWVCHHINTPYNSADSTTWAPGWDAGDIMDQILAEARTRVCQPIQRITVGWTPSHDSAGVVWPAPIARQFAVGADYLDIAGQLAETSMDWRMAASLNSDGTAKLTLKLYKHLGVDRTIASNNTSGVSVAYIPGNNVDEAEFDGDASAIKTQLLIKTATGWVEDTSSTIGTYERWESFLQAGQGEDDLHAQAVAAAAFARAAVPTEALTLKGHSVTHHTPFVDFDIGDSIWAPGDNGNSKYRVIALTLAENTDGVVQWTPELSDIRTTKLHKITRHLKAQAKGKSGAGSLNGRVTAAMPVTMTPMDVVNTGALGQQNEGHQVLFSYSGSALAPSTSPPYIPMYDETLVEVSAAVNDTDPGTDMVLRVLVDGGSVGTLILPHGSTYASMNLSEYLTADTSRLTVELVDAGGSFQDLTVMARLT